MKSNNVIPLNVKNLKIKKVNSKNVEIVVEHIIVVVIVKYLIGVVYISANI